MVIVGIPSSSIRIDPLKHLSLHRWLTRRPYSSHDFSTVSRTRFSYSFWFSLYRFDASTLAGDPVFGSLSKLDYRLARIHRVG